MKRVFNVVVMLLCCNFVVKTTSRANKHNIAITPLSTKTVLRDIVKILLKNDNGQSKTFPCMLW